MSSCVFYIAQLFGVICAFVIVLFALTFVSWLIAKMIKSIIGILKR